MSPDLVAADRAWLAACAACRPQAVALHCEGIVTFASLAEEAERLARVLRRLGMESGSRVAVLMPPSRRFAALLHAAQRLGAVFVPLGGRLTERELAVQLELSAPAVFIADDALEAAASSALRAQAALRGTRFLRSRDLDSLSPAGGPLPDEIDPSAALTILFTSGTESRPKAVVSTNRNHHASACSVLAHLDASEKDVWTCVLPLSHVGGLSILLRSVLAGFAVALEPLFDPAGVRRSFDASTVGFVSLVPTMLARILDTVPGGRAPQGLRAVVCGGAALSPALAKRAGAAGYPIIATYGLTETASQVTATLPGSLEPEQGMSGRPLAGVELRIAEPDGDGIGEILVRAPQVMAGYWRDELATASALAGGWLHTGDVGRLSADGSLVVVDRRADLIVSGGENVAPAEVEAVLLEHPLIADAGVYPEPDELWGQRVCAAVVVRAGETLDTESLVAWCRSRLARFKIPGRFVPVASLPRTTSGKLRRRELLESMRRVD